jgi:hypothetical protein
MDPLSQRWRDRRDSFRRPGEEIRTADYEVVELMDDTTPKAFVVAHHYSGSYPAARYRFGLYRHDELAGVAVFSHPCRNEVLTNVFPGDAMASVELGRLVLLDDVKYNGESWFVARCFDCLRAKGLSGVLSFSDPVPRVSDEGRVVHRGHIGCIYQATNGVYLGRATRRTLHLLPSGHVFSDRAISKIRAKERGWEYSAELLLRAGAEPVDHGDLRGWLKRSMASFTRRIRHAGNHKYAWALDRATKKTMKVPAVRLPYPKADAR